MPVIELETHIHASIELCFDLSLSIDLHQVSTSRTREKAISGITSGLIGLNETVTWEAVHFGIRQQLTSKITQLERPFHFRDEQLKGAFHYILHDHFFTPQQNGTIMKDRFEFEAPFGLLGKAVSRLVLTNYLSRFLRERNEVIKKYAEEDAGQDLLKRSARKNA